MGCANAPKRAPAATDEPSGPGTIRKSTVKATLSDSPSRLPVVDAAASEMLRMSTRLGCTWSLVATATLKSRSKPARAASSTRMLAAAPSRRMLAVAATFTNVGTSHAVLASESWSCLPIAVQLITVDEPSGQYVPALQSTQSVVLSESSSTVPASHGLQLLIDSSPPAVQYCPGRHGEHGVAAFVSLST